MIRAIVIGGAPSTWIEVELAKNMANFDMVVAVNRAGVDYRDKIDHWVSYHPEEFPEWIDERALYKESGPVGKYWTSHEKAHRVSCIKLERMETWGGSSGLLGAAVALHNGADKTVLCGVPLDYKVGHYHSKSAWGDMPWSEASKYRQAWLHAMPRLRDKVKSMSGWTARHLGAPTQEWLDV